LATGKSSLFKNGSVRFSKQVVCSLKGFQVQVAESASRLVGTKIDLATRLVQEPVARDWAKSKGMPYFEVSAAQGRNVETVFKEMASRLS
jgi:GTPase involved in cell partitioning and DNA repair